MSSTSQIVANQKNAQSSTGPRTAEGKDASSQNAIRYGQLVSGSHQFGLVAMLNQIEKAIAMV